MLTLPGRIDEIGPQRVDRAPEDQLTIGIPHRLPLCSTEDDIVKKSSQSLCYACGARLAERT